jgi:thymidylate kinase
MAHFVIIEGPDGSGKTTLAKKLEATFTNARIVHFSAPATKEDADNYWKVYAQMIEDAQENEVVIFDRSWYSDMVYGPVLRGRVEMDPLAAKMLEASVMQHGGGVVIYCTGNVKTLWARCKTRGETFIKTIEDLEELKNAYEDVMRTHCNLPMVRTDTVCRW